MVLSLPFTLAACTSDDSGVSGSDTDPTSGTAETSTTDSTTSTSGETGSTGDTTMGDTGVDTTDTDTDTDTGEPACDPNVVALPGDMFFPEGIDAAADGTLYVGSLGTGEIVAITPCVGTDDADVVEVLHDGSATMAVVGVLVDAASNVVWACSSDPTGVAAPSILGFSLDDGSLVATHAIDEGFCNDLALDGDGNLYATESFVSRIMRVEQVDLLTDTDAEEWSNDSLYEVGPGEFGLNGIAFDGLDRMYVLNSAAGEMYETAIQGNGNAANPDLVDLGDTLFMGGDGLEPEAPDTFLVVENGAGTLTRVSIAEAGNTVAAVDNTFDVPTTAVVVGPAVWVVESQLDHLFAPDVAGPPELPFVIVRREL